MNGAMPRLTRLELQGFKSFASRTVFSFERGITVVVGPNGSGKSNISDAVRWVLGEQSHHALRSKRTDDVIFAGGQGRAPAGFAEVAVTFDNADHWLPIEFAEVTVSRKAYRSGENQYLINNRRVRLKDVAHLTASLGQSHLVVGQGLVDAALSQRAEDRRGLFEHAADLTGLRLKASEAERSLAETEHNNVRLTDLLAEVEPRLKTMQRAARQAHEWRGLHARLQALQREHYRDLLLLAQQAVATATAAEETEAAAVATGQATLDRLVTEETEARASGERARAALARHETRRQAAADQARGVAHERDMTSERHTALGRRREDMADTQAGLEDQVGAVAAELEQVIVHLTTLEQEVGTARQSVARRQTATARTVQQRTDLALRVDDLVKTLAGQERAAASLGQQRALRDQRRTSDAAEREQAIGVATDRAARIAAIRQELDAADAAAGDDATALDALAARLRDLDRAAARATTAARAAREAVAAIERRHGQATARHEVLQRLHESGTGLRAGVHETLAAAKAGVLHGVRGAVAGLIALPLAYDTAIEVALGGHVQDIVVETWADAEAAIAHLKRANSGRATFQPLETVRARGGVPAIPTTVVNVAGVHGVAATLVEAEREVRGVVDSLLGRMLVVEDLPTARAVLPLMPPGWSAVTLAGEIARSGGSVTGGGAVRESGVLGRERELRELPGEIRRLADARGAAIGSESTALEAVRTVAAEQQATRAEHAALVAAGNERRGQRQRLAGWLADLQVEQTATERRTAGLDRAVADGAEAVVAIDAERADLATAMDETRAALAASRSELERATAETETGDRELAAEQQRLAALEERLRAERRREAGLRAQERALADELSLRGERAAALDGERIALAAQHRRLTKEATALDQVRQQIEAERPPLEEAMRQAEQASKRLARALDLARTDAMARERMHGAAELQAERTLGELDTIRQRIADDLDLADPDELLNELLSFRGGGVSEELPSFGGGNVSEENDESEWERTPTPKLAPSETPKPSNSATLEREIARMKARLRQVGYIGEDAVAEYEREAEHQAFLRTQLADVQGAAAALRDLLADLHATMRDRFDETFSKVVVAFGETFTTLFGGGSARLILTGSSSEAGQERDAPGIDIVAQPPGKRLQSLALLSGGERALTAAALLFAILRVNPAPFCLLDEVDAALDEANIVRFREQLQTLAADTQVIVITHNRGTIEIADTLYGVSMGDDGVSQVLSLRLAETAAD